MTRYQLINKLITKFNYQTYLEIGVADGSCFNRIEINTKESVDPASDARYVLAKPTYKMTSDEFFIKNTNTYDIIFIDGLHHSEQVDKDIKNSLGILNEGGIILLHDCNAVTEISQRVPRESSYWVGDVWKSIVKYRYETSNLEYGCMTLHLLPNEQDMSIIKRTLRHTFDVKMPDTLDYNWLDNNRYPALGLIEDVENFINDLK